MIWSILIILLMIVFSAFFSGSEISFNASNKLRLKKAVEAGEKPAAVAYKISENFTTALSAILIGNNLANIAASTAATVIIVEVTARSGISDGVASVISTALMTLIILIFGEIVPKILAKRNADIVVKWVAYPIKILTIILYPLVAIVMLLIKLLSKIWGSDKPDDAPTVTEDELSSIIETVEEEGIIDENQGELLQSTIDFPDTTVEEIMIPRIDMTYIYIEDDYSEIQKTIEDSRYSRIPVCEDSVDNIIGILSVNHYYKASINGEKVDIRSLLIEPCLVHKTMKLPVALRTLREKKTHIAIVVDEFGGTLGMFTMENILEELVGDIWDESDEIVREIIQTGPCTYEVTGDMNIDDFFEQINFNPPADFECEYSTVGGWAVEALNAEPHVGDNFSLDNLYMVVLEMDDLRVTKLTALLEPKDDEDDEEE